MPRDTYVTVLARLALALLIALPCASLPGWSKIKSERSPSEGDIAKAEAMFAKGHKAFDQQNVRKAEEFYRQAIQLNPREARYHRQLCLLLTHMRRGQEAQREALVAMSIEPNDWRSMILLGSLYNLEKRYDEEILIYRRAVAAMPDSEKAVRERLQKRIAHGELSMKQQVERERRRRELEEAEYRKWY